MPLFTVRTPTRDRQRIFAPEEAFFSAETDPGINFDANTHKTYLPLPWSTSIQRNFEQRERIWFPKVSGLYRVTVSFEWRTDSNFVALEATVIAASEDLQTTEDLLHWYNGSKAGVGSVTLTRLTQLTSTKGVTVWSEDLGVAGSPNFFTNVRLEAEWVARALK